VCGYHGWHDWYLAANLAGEESLDGHLLPGLNPTGVPSNLKGSVIPFTYNRLDELEDIIRTNEVGVIKMEVVRNQGPENGFLQKVRDLATLNKIVLVFDECTSGFRQSFGGIHMKYGVEPDMAIFGKALGNGYAITAVVGREEIMDNAQSTFISSTFWTERIGPTAALKTLEIMERERSWETVTDTGNVIREGWTQLADKYELPITINGIPAISSFNFATENALAYKTLVTQELLKKGYLASNLIFVSTSHTDDVLDGYFEALDPVFALIRDCQDGLEVNTVLDGPICHSGFKRLN
jgi:glutamate-1-semialdehyde 2,1-aminomutase